MKWAFGIALLGAALLPNISSSLGSGAIPPAKARTTKPVQSKSSTSSAKTSSTRRKARGRYSKRAPAPSYQLHPDPARYQQIQQALAERGYFKGEVNGQWGDDSVDALKRFQADQKMLDDGKISSLTLIGLGLGPKHNGSTVSSTASSTAPANPLPAAGDSAPPH